MYQRQHNLFILRIMTKIGIFGGTYDPIHIGHLITAQTVYEQRNLDKILFIPCNISPHKVGLHTAPAKDRLEMVKLATAPVVHFEVSDYEIRKGEVSYTYDTIKHFVSQGCEIELIIGYDNLLVFDKWREPEAILELAKVLVLKRKPETGSNEFNKFFQSVDFLDTPIIEISSTEIRERIRKGMSIDFFVPDSVKDYIERNKLYKY